VWSGVIITLLRLMFDIQIFVIVISALLNEVLMFCCCIVVQRASTIFFGCWCEKIYIGNGIILVMLTVLMQRCS